jgi:hypothetical protein
MVKNIVAKILKRSMTLAGMFQEMVGWQKLTDPPCCRGSFYRPGAIV